MPQLCAQGDILIERVDDVEPAGRAAARPVGNGLLVLAEGEATGHRHRLFGSVTMYRDDALARDIPRGLYVGHVRIDGPAARLEHEEHVPIVLPHGTYRVRRQRQLEPMDSGFHDDAGLLED